MPTTVYKHYTAAVFANRSFCARRCIHNSCYHRSPPKCHRASIERRMRANIHIHTQSQRVEWDGHRTREGEGGAASRKPSSNRCSFTIALTVETFFAVCVCYAMRVCIGGICCEIYVVSSDCRVRFVTYASRLCCGGGPKHIFNKNYS